MNLSGTWGALVADDDLRRTWLDEGPDAPADGDWEPIEVPGHWRSTPAFAETDGPLLYRTRFDHPKPVAGRRHWLRLDGLFYQGDVWLDGGYVGDTEGYFQPHTFEITDALADRSEHLLGIETTCARPTDRTAKRNITGVFQHWDCLDPDWNPGGIWRPVRLEETGPVRIRRLRMICREVSSEQAVVVVTAMLDALEATTVSLRTTIGEVERVDEHPLAAGRNEVELVIGIPEPRLWWPHALGDQPQYDAALDVVLEDGEVSHRVTRRLGIRQLSLRDWILHVNGERMFVKGANHGPTRMALGEATPEELANDVHLAKDAGLDLLRVHAHITRPEFYDAADEAGLLLWQDFPLQWGYARAIKKQAVSQAVAAVDLLGHHPAIAIWCAHNEPLRLDVDPGADFDVSAHAGKFFVGQELPTWNKTVLDRAVKRAIEGADSSRPVIPHSGVLPHPPKLDGTDTHIYFGWYHGEERSFPRFTRTLPRMARFVSEFGAQAVPATADFMEPERWPDLDWEALGRTRALQKSAFDRYVPPADYATFDEWRLATQRYQSTVIKHHIETLRRLKYRPTGGFAQFCFADGHPSVTWSVLGHDRQPKLGFDALRDACRPVIVVAERPPATVLPGGRLKLDVHVVSDLREPLTGVVVTATMRWDGGEQTWRWGGDLEADSCARVGTMAALAPTTEGQLRVELALEADGHTAVNSYETRVTR